MQYATLSNLFVLGQHVTQIPQTEPPLDLAPATQHPSTVNLSNAPSNSHQGVTLLPVPSTTLIPIPVPISVPMPLQGGGQGTIILTPPAPPPQHLVQAAPPHQTTAQEMASMMMMLMMNQIRERMETRSRIAKEKEAAGHEDDDDEGARHLARGYPHTREPAWMEELRALELQRLRLAASQSQLPPSLYPANPPSTEQRAPEPPAAVPLQYQVPASPPTPPPPPVGILSQKRRKDFVPPPMPPPQPQAPGCCSCLGYVKFNAREWSMLFMGLSCHKNSIR